MEKGDCPPTSVCGNQIRDALPSPNPVGRDNVHLKHILSSSPEQRRARAIKIFKDAMLKLSRSQNPSLSQSEEEMFAKRIDLCLPSLLPSSLHTPNHPPYALMIITALRELNRKKGSKEGSISSFIKSKYQDLPLAHEHLLTHHLETLVSRGEVISVTKSLYTLPGGNDNSEKHQQIAMKGEIVEGETGEDDIGGRALIICALPAVVEPVSLDDSGGGLMSVCGKHAHNLAELEPMGGDVTGGGLENSEAVNEAIAPLRRVLPGHGRGRRPKKKIEEEQPHNRLDELVGPVHVDGFCGALVSLSEKDPLTLTELQMTGGDVVTGRGSMHSEALPEAVGSLQKLLPRRSLRRLSQKKIENDHQQNEIGKGLGQVYADDFDGDVMSLTEKHPCDLIEHDSVNCDNDSSGGSKPLSAGIEEVESPPGLERGSSLNHAFKDEKGHNKVVEAVEHSEVDDFFGSGSMCVSEKHPTSLIEQSLTNGDVDTGGGSKYSVVEAVEILPSEKIEDQQRQNEVADVVELLGDNDNCDGGSLMSVTVKQSPVLTEVQSMGGDMDNGGGLKSSATVNELVDPLQKILPVREQSRRLKRKRADEQKKKEVVNTEETIPSSMAILVATNKDGEEDLAVENGSQEKKPRGRGRPPKKYNRKQ